MLATAALELFPGVKISIGPPIENGFYYDFDFPEGTTLTEDDLGRARGEDAPSTSRPTSRSSAPT